MINVGTVGAYLTLDISDFETHLMAAGQRLSDFRNAQTDDFLGFGKTLLAGLASPLLTIGLTADDCAARIRRSLGGLSGVAQAAGSVFAGLTRGAESTTGAVAGAFGRLPVSARGAVDNACAGMKKALENARPGLSSSAGRNGEAIVTALEHSLRSSSGGTSAVGQRATDRLIAGLNARRPAALSAARSIMQGMAAAAGSVSFTGIGGNIVNGIIRGINSKKPSLITTASNLAASAAAAAKSALGIHSPSRVMMEVGRFTAEGLELGLKQGSRSLYETASAISLETAETLGDISSPALRFSGSPSGGTGDKLQRLLDAVEKLADSQTTMEIDGRPFGRLVREARSGAALR